MLCCAVTKFVIADLPASVTSVSTTVGTIGRPTMGDTNNDATAPAGLSDTMWHEKPGRPATPNGPSGCRCTVVIPHKSFGPEAKSGRGLGFWGGQVVH